jgi:hypothetical protein
VQRPDEVRPVFVGPSMWEVLAHPDTALEIERHSDEGVLRVDGQRAEARIVADYGDDKIVRIRPL